MDGRAGQRNAFPQLTLPYFNIQDYDTRVSGANVLLRWTHRIDETSDWMV